MASLGQLRMWSQDGETFVAVYTASGWYEMGYDPADLEQIATLLLDMADDAKRGIDWHAWECVCCGKQQAFDSAPPVDRVCMVCQSKGRIPVC